MIYEGLLLLPGLVSKHGEYLVPLLVILPEQLHHPLGESVLDKVPEREGLFSFKDQLFIGLGPGDVSPVVPEQDRHKLSILELDSSSPEVHLVEAGGPVDVPPHGADGQSHVDRLAGVQE